MKRLWTHKIAPSSVTAALLAGYVAVFVALATAFGLLGDQAAVARIGQISLAALLVGCGLFILDALLIRGRPEVEVDRRCARSIAVDRWTEVQLTVHHHFTSPAVVTLFDDLSAGGEFENLPVQVSLQPGKKSSVFYRLKVSVRGPFAIGRCHVRVPSPLRLWKRQYHSGNAMHIKVYPDFSAISAFTILATDHHESQIGIKRKPRRGEGLEFMQLRDYRSGDSLRQVDWKATSRRNQLISREYQDERDQQIVLLIDSGRRMRSKDDTLSHFDHSLNAMLLVSYIALRQGDSVSVMSFGQSHRWVAPQKGVGAMKIILNGMYDLQAGNYAPDYVAAAEKLSLLQRKRSMVILVTNSRDEEIDELLMAANLIRRRHVLLLANIREEIVEQLADNAINDLDDALVYAGLHQYLKRRAEVQQRITATGVFAIDCIARQLAVRVANSYLEIKRAGVL